MRRTLGQRLALRIAAAAAICLTAVAGAGFALWALTERTGAGGESIGEELLEQLGPAAAIALAGVVAAVLAARWLTRRATARIDHVVATAARVGAHDLSARLPVSADGDEVDELSVALNRMLARIEHGVAAQRRFAADASHELRTPLTAALSALEVARRRPRSAGEWEVSADRAITELARMSTLIDALLQLARADAGQGDRAAVPLAALVDRVADHVGAPITSTVGAAVVVDADPAALEIALGNLIANAAAHGPAGAPVAVSATDDGDQLRIDVVDRGPGVAAADRARIFEPFVRGAEARADRVAHGAGVGLGLPIARRIAEAHGGRLDVDDAPGGGARFSLWLPRRR